MAEKKIDFGVQADILDRFVHLPDLQSDPEGARIVVKRIKESPDLLRYFLGRGPSPAWAEIMYREGLFDHPPQVIHLERGYQTPPWQLSSYLANVARSAPQTVIRVIDQIDTDNPVVQEDLLRALSQIPADNAASRLDKIKLWLANPYTGPYWGLPEAVAVLMIHLGKHDRIQEALDLLDELIRPAATVPSSHGDSTMGGEALSRFELSYQRPDFWNETVPKLERLARQQVVRVLERNLLLAIQLEVEALGANEVISPWRTFGWRSSIDDTAQDIDTRHKDRLLVALRSALERWIDHAAEGARPLIDEYLHRDEIILRRIALFVVGLAPFDFPDLVEAELGNRETHNDIRINNEYFHLLAEGFPALASSARSKVISIIQQGPDQDRTNDLAKRVSRVTGEDPGQYATRFAERWIRDRLWTIRDRLPNDAEQTLHHLLDQYDKPDHPEFLTWSSGVYRVVDESPVSIEEIASMSQASLLEYLASWEPADRSQIGAVQISRKGLADAVSSVILGNPEQYEDLIVGLAAAPPENSAILFNSAAEALKAGAELPWHAFLALAKEMTINLGNSYERAMADESRAARLAAVRFIVTGLELEDHLPEELFTRVEDVLTRFLNDPDPDEGIDHPEEGWVGHGDPATIALNAIRPTALIGIMRLISRRRQLEKSDQERGQKGDLAHQILPPSLRATLEAKLDKSEDPSWAVHSVFGRFFGLLDAVATNWVEEVRPKVFPKGDDMHIKRYFAAAWDSYVIFNGPSQKLLRDMRSEYAYAIQMLANGEGTRTHLDPGQRLAFHVLMDYLWEPYDLSLQPNESNLVGLFFSLCGDDLRASAVWTLWKLGESMSERDRQENWPAIARLWQWRTNQVLLSNYPKDFAKEMARFAQIPAVAPQVESMASMWPLLQSLLPYCREFGAWRALEGFLANQVESSPGYCAKYYRLMHEETNEVKGYFHSYNDESDKILITASENLSSRKDALAVMDRILRSGNDRYQETYRRYTA